MSMVCDQILDHVGEASAVATFAQVLADCESTNFSVAQQAHEDVQEMRLSMSDTDFDNLLTEATEVMFRNGLKPQLWLAG